MTIAPKKPRQEGVEKKAAGEKAPASASRSGEAKAGGSGSAKATASSKAASSSAKTRPLVPSSVAASASLSVSSPKASPAAGVPSPELAGPVEEGRNSDDECEERGPVPLSALEAEAEAERVFGERLTQAGLSIKRMGEDGACLFRSVAHQLYGDEEMHGSVRQLTLDYMEKNRDYFSQFVTEDWREYVRRKRAPDAHGNHVEIQAMAELFSRPIQVFQPGASVASAGPIRPINTFQAPSAGGEGEEAEETNPPIRVSYHGSVHYNSVVEPWGPATVGIGLGLPGLAPGHAQRDALREAAVASEREGIEAAMLQDKLRATDQEATEDKLAEQVARESYLQFVRDQEGRLKDAPSTSSSKPHGLPSAVGQGPKRSPLPTTSAAAGLSSKPSSPKASSSTPATDSGAESGVGGLGRELGEAETASILHSFPPALFGLSDMDVGEEGGDVLSRVLALSQQEYLESLKTSHPAPSQAPSTSAAADAPPQEAPSTSAQGQ